MNLIGTEDAAAILEISEQELRTLVKRKVVPGQRVAGRLVFDEEEILELNEEWDSDEEEEIDSEEPEDFDEIEADEDDLEEEE